MNDKKVLNAGIKPFRSIDHETGRLDKKEWQFLMGISYDFAGRIEVGAIDPKRLALDQNAYMQQGSAEVDVHECKAFFQEWFDRNEMRAIDKAPQIEWFNALATHDMWLDRETFSREANTYHGVFGRRSQFVWPDLFCLHALLTNPQCVPLTWLYQQKHTVFAGTCFIDRETREERVPVFSVNRDHGYKFGYYLASIAELIKGGNPNNPGNDYQVIIIHPYHR